MLTIKNEITNKKVALIIATLYETMILESNSAARSCGVNTKEFVRIMNKAEVKYHFSVGNVHTANSVIIPNQKFSYSQLDLLKELIIENYKANRGWMIYTDARRLLSCLCKIFPKRFTNGGIVYTYYDFFMDGNKIRTIPSEEHLVWYNGTKVHLADVL